MKRWLGVVLLWGLAGTAGAQEKIPVQIVQLLDMVGISADEAEQILQKELVDRGYQVIAITEKPKEYYVLNILDSNVAAGGAIATGLSAVVSRYDSKSDQEILVDHSSTVILVSGPDMEASARKKGVEALRGMVSGLDKAVGAR